MGAFLLISQLLEDFVPDRFDAETFAIADSLIGKLEVEGDTPLGVRFTLPLSLVLAGRDVAHSFSLLDGRLNGPTGDLIEAAGPDSDGAGLRVLRRELTIPDSDALIAVTVTPPLPRWTQAWRRSSGRWPWPWRCWDWPWPA